MPFILMTKDKRMKSEWEFYCKGEKEECLKELIKLTNSYKTKDIYSGNSLPLMYKIIKKDELDIHK